jgi:hypothetical protein
MLNSTTPEWLTSARLKYAKKLENQNPKAFQTLEEINGSHDLIKIIKIDDLSTICNSEKSPPTVKPNRINSSEEKNIIPPPALKEKPGSVSKSLQDKDFTQKNPISGPPEKTFTYTGPEDPDGLNERIIGKFEKLLKHDAHLLQARAWKIHPAKLTVLLKAGKHEAIKREVEFVAGNDSVSNPGAYLNVLLRKV